MSILSPRLPRRFREVRWIALVLVVALLAVQRCKSEGPSGTLSTEIREQCSPARLSDGDSLTCVGGARLRLIGIDAPELSQTPLGRQSQNALDAIISGEPLRLEYDVEARDEFGRLLAYAWSGSTFINERMVRDGWAVAFHVPPNRRYATRLRAAEEAARAKRAGHWSTGGFECLPVDHRAGRC